MFKWLPLCQLHTPSASHMPPCCFLRPQGLGRHGGSSLIRADCCPSVRTALTSGCRARTAGSCVPRSVAAASCSVLPESSAWKASLLWIAAHLTLSPFCLCTVNVAPVLFVQIVWLVALSAFCTSASQSPKFCGHNLQWPQRYLVRQDGTHGLNDSSGRFGRFVGLFQAAHRLHDFT